ncbi:hypothetical protein ACFL5O_02420 [Myxococcota bacterium]
MVVCAKRCDPNTLSTAEAGYNDTEHSLSLYRLLYWRKKMALNRTRGNSLAVVTALVGAAALIACGGEDEAAKTPGKASGGRLQVASGGSAAKGSGGRSSGGQSKGGKASSGDDSKSGSGAKSTGGRRSVGGTASTSEVGDRASRGGRPSSSGREGESGGAGPETACAQGIQTGDVCDSDVDTTCDRSDSTADPRTCVCGSSDTWTCTSIGTVGAAGASSEDAAGARRGVDPAADESSGPGAAGSCQGVRSGESCDPSVDTVCDRSDSTADPRICECGSDGTWTCTSVGGEDAGGAGPGPATPATGPGSAGSCQGVQSGESCDPSVDTVCDRSDSTADPRICECGSDGTWTCTSIDAGSGGQGSGGAPGVPAGGSEPGAGGTCQRGVQTGDSCEPSVDSSCDRSDSTADPRICECGSNGTWTCTSIDAGSGGQGSGGAPGVSAGGSEPGAGGTCQQGVQTGDSCEPDVDSRCDRSDSTVDPRTCECRTDGTWRCTSVDAGGGASAGGGQQQLGEGTCQQGVQTGDSCEPDVDSRCDRSDSTADPRTCECRTDGTWRCTSVDAGGGASAGGGQQQLGEGTCQQGVQTGDSCEPDVDSRCDRSDSTADPRTCECRTDGTWRCTSVDAGGGASAGGGQQQVGEGSCQRGVQTGDSCEPNVDSRCDRSDSTADPRTCECRTDGTWRCTSVD